MNYAEPVDLSDLEGRRLVAVTAAQFTQESDPPVITEVWLQLESLVVNVYVASDWVLRVTPGVPGEGYVMEELGGRVDVISAPAEVPFVRHIGDRLLRVVEQFDDEAVGQCVEVEFAFERGCVIARSFGGDLYVAHA
ncbi:hypothetical protein [Nonomuraea dietziae]|uniref:hypothetical protein n=1 Tax=Nonomuraea dietziae TaxID=65515 RepID=UPI003422ED67